MDAAGTAGGVGWLLSAVAFAVSMSATPGPNNAMVAASGASFGFRRTVPHMLGIAVGFPVMLVVVALGAGEPLRTLPWLHEALRWVGAAYLLWLAWRIAAVRPGTPGSQGAGPGRPLTFVQAALFQWVNPKAWVIAAGAVVTYTTGGAVLGQASALAALFLLAGLLSTTLWTATGVGVARTLRGPHALRAFNLVMAGLLVASLFPLLREP